MKTDTEHAESTKRPAKPRIYQEDAKTRQTSHWDWDYLPLSTLERLTREKRPASRGTVPRENSGDQRRMAWLCIAAGAVLLLAGVLAVMVYAGRPAL